MFTVFQWYRLISYNERVLLRIIIFTLSMHVRFLVRSNLDRKRCLYLYRDLNSFYTMGLFKLFIGLGVNFFRCCGKFSESRSLSYRQKGMSHDII